jgi:hypothetical protein
MKLAKAAYAMLDSVISSYEKKPRKVPEESGYQFVQR